MSDHELTPLEAMPAERSVVKIEVNSKGSAQAKVAVFEGTTEAEMERLRLLAFKTFDAVQDDLRKSGAILA